MSEENRRATDKIALRLPEGLRDKIAIIAERNNRSTNSEIVARLLWTLDQDQSFAGPIGRVPVSNETTQEQRLAKLERQYQALFDVLNLEYVEQEGKQLKFADRTE